MSETAILSIYPEHVARIARRTKTHEFRKYLIGKEINTLLIYVTRPVSELKYIATIGSLVQYPDQIKEEGHGNTEFNQGLKRAKFAYPILHLDEIVHGLSLTTLREKFSFFPPQRYVYAFRYPQLLKHVTTCEKKRLY